MSEQLDPRLDGLLVCPRCRGELLARSGHLECPAERLRWPVREGIPHLSPEYTEPAPTPEP